MDISRKPVLFHLTTAGRNAIGRFLPDKASFQALVLGTDGVGAWVLFPGVKGLASGEPAPVMLVKWEYVSTLVFEFKPDTPPARRTMGFVSAHGKKL